MKTTMTEKQLAAAVSSARRYPHKKVHKGDVVISPDAFEPDGWTNLVVSPYAILDCTGSIHIGPGCNIGPRSRIYTHDAIHLGRMPLYRIEEKFGVFWQDKYIGSDVWIHDGAIVLCQAAILPDGFVLGAGSVLTRNPGPWEIWAGVPAVKVGEREELSEEEIREMIQKRPRFIL